MMIDFQTLKQTLDTPSTLSFIATAMVGASLPGMLIFYLDESNESAIRVAALLVTAVLIQAASFIKGHSDVQKFLRYGLVLIAVLIFVIATQAQHLTKFITIV